ncbi:SDR family NAD(P)-dependent oxidoreductase [Bradyrhizobium viridifuturi]|uniref:SDR family NAD(P)-dependent oxidoreductase n=1 Tax=Bradyrhizobium viridifuturi TaxID=1654716 RepID=UPI00067F5B0C|nr:glucose 1-dehydrogenase [Bradyrhizobium viridifuturi]
MTKGTQDRPRDWMRHSRLKGLVAIVVGAGSGIGEETARIIAANEGMVVVADIREQATRDVASAIVADGGKAVAVALDVGNQAHIDAAVARTIREFGQLDIVVNAAAVVKASPLETSDLEDWKLSFRINVEGAIMLARTCLPHLRKSTHASIVQVASLAGIGAYPNGGAYGVTKAALIALTKTMAMEWVTDGVRVNVVSPGTVETPLMRAVLTPEVVQQRAARIPMERLGQPSELADTIVFLASPMASFITGQNLNCDGGLSQALMVQKFNPDL